jgi:hypothetical protein
VIDAGDNTVATVLDGAGAPRVVDGDSNGTATVDMGALEFQSDFDQDGIPDNLDTDDDNDGVPDVSDCASLTRAISQPPDRVSSSLRLSKAGLTATLKWLHAYQAPTYNVYRGTFGGVAPFYNETCFATENATRTVDDNATPPLGTGYYYIVGSRNTCGESAAVTAETNGQNLQYHTPSPTCTTLNQNSDGDPPRDIGDNCPLFNNLPQGDVDADSQGDACDNCPSLANVDQADLDGDLAGNACDPDADGDGVANAQDCSPLDPAVSAPSGEVVGLVLAKGATTGLSWTPLPGGTLGYDISGGVLSLLRSAGSSADASCLKNDAVNSSWDDQRPDPVEDDGYYYLVRGRNGCGDGTYGYATGGAERVPGVACP